MVEFNPEQNFKYDLKIGLEAEGKLASILEDSKIEVKKDRLAGQTGNIAVEFEYRGKKSGITTTEATHWAFMINNDKTIIIVEVERLKNIAREFYKLGSTVFGGDDNKSKLVLIPISQLIK